MIGLARRLPGTEWASGTPVDAHPALHRVWTCGFTWHTPTPGNLGGRSTKGTVQATEKGMPSRHTVTCIHTYTHNLNFQTIDIHMRSSSLNEHNEEFRYHTPNKNCKHIRVALENVFEIFWKYF